MNYLITAGISALTFFLGVFGIYNYAPYSIDSLAVEGNLGAITTLVGTESLSDFPTTYNANLAQLMRMSTTSVDSITTLTNLVSIGTITTGIWTGTTITVANGGTGSTTLLANGVLYGNGTSGVLAVPIGSNDQVLTLSSGVPVWASGGTDETLNYNWTGTHRFTTFHSSSTMVLNGISLSFPPTQAVGSSTVLANDGSGNLTWETPRPAVATTSTIIYSNNSQATTTFFTYEVVADTLSGSSVIMGSFGMQHKGNNNNFIQISLKFGGQLLAFAEFELTTGNWTVCANAGTQRCGSILSFFIINDENGNQTGTISNDQGAETQLTVYPISVDVTAQQTLLLEGRDRGTASTLFINSAFVQVLK
ncbi:MAG TPA: hypothetical protein ENI23_10685 [bacterium]|nr:hypothetical protein [bacterium]